MVREKEIPVQQQKMESFADSFRKSLESITVRSRENALSQGEASIPLNLLRKELIRNRFIVSGRKMLSVVEVFVESPLGFWDGWGVAIPLVKMNVILEG